MVAWLILLKNVMNSRLLANSPEQPDSSIFAVRKFCFSLLAKHA